ncbi:MAG: hypothetical protein GYB67_01105, partial [Chloroflexi bacterium]|nr:hypothetical protein [Chloroflexota bacterium]
MRRLFPVLVLALLLSVSGLGAQPDAALTLVRTDLTPAQSVGLMSSVTLFFDRPVACDSAQTAVRLSPPNDGTVTCADAAVTFTPLKPFVPDTRYDLSIDATLRGLDGSTLAVPETVTFQTAGTLAVAEVLPADGSNFIAADAAITVIFNRPVVPLVIVEDMDDLPDPLVFDPPVTGEGEWLNTSIYVFRPDPGMAGGTLHTATVTAPLTAVDGSTLAEPFRWTFRTTAPTVTGVIPEDGTGGVELDAPVQVTFNVPMDRAGVERSFRLQAVGGGGAGAAEAVPGTFAWADDDTGFMFTPEANLRLGQDYQMTFSDPLPTGAGGGAPIFGQRVFAFETVPPPAIVNTDPFDGETDVSAVFGGLTITFASPMNQETLLDAITIAPEPWREPDAFYSRFDNSYRLSFPTEPSTDYTITIAPGMEDVYGNRIGSERVIRYTTAPYPPSVLLQTPGDVGFYSAYREPTQLFLTHRNISAVDLALYAVPLERFLPQVTGEFYYDPGRGFTPDGGDLLRQWQIESVAPENLRRYELLDLRSGGGGISAVECPGAPPSRLRVGDSAVVITDPDPLRARASAPDGEILTLLYRDYRLSVVGGPLCINNFVWWEVELREGERAWVAEGDQVEYYLDLQTPAQRTPVAVAETEGEGLAPGVYYLTADAPELGRQFPLDHFLVVGTANLTVKASVDSLDVWATDVDSGLPIADAPITVYDGSGAELGSGVTDASGLVRIATPRADNLYVGRVALLQTEAHFGLGVIHWSEGIDPWRFGQRAEFYPEPYRGYLYTDRPIYRPEQPVYFRGVLRSADDVTYTPPDFDTIPVQIYNDQNEIVYNQTLALTAFGTFSGQFDIAADASLGFYRIVAQLPGEEQQPFGSSVTVGFNVAEFRAPEFQVTVTPETDEVVQGATIRALVESQFFFGGSVSGADVEYNVIAQPYAFDPNISGRFSFTDFDADGGPGVFFGPSGGRVTSGMGVTDAQGRFMIEFPADLEDATQSQRFTIEAAVSDESGQLVAGRAEVIVHTG